METVNAAGSGQIHYGAPRANIDAGFPKCSQDTVVIRTVLQKNPGDSHILKAADNRHRVFLPRSNYGPVGNAVRNRLTAGFSIGRASHRYNPATALFELFFDGGCESFAPEGFTEQNEGIRLKKISDVSGRIRHSSSPL